MSQPKPNAKSNLSNEAGARDSITDFAESLRRLADEIDRAANYGTSLHRIAQRNGVTAEPSGSAARLMQSRCDSALSSCRGVLDRFIHIQTFITTSQKELVNA